ncbi:MAG: T9SS type A sorting domain-containing protein [Porphyromonas sp.]|nr:T9SS type A sorting domain-containing protein [Porphyromonas sp.]
MNKLSRPLILLSVVVGLLVLPLVLHAQQEFPGRPMSFAHQSSTTSLRSTLVNSQVLDVPLTVSIEDIKETQEWRATSGGAAPLLVGYNLDLNIDFAKEAQPVRLSNGRVIYRLHLRSEGALEVAPLYSDFYIPRGGKLYTYDPHGLVLRGAYTHETNPDGGPFSTSNVPGEEIILEYEPDESGAMPRLQIERLAHYFRRTMQERVGESEDASIPGETVNVNCPQGDEWKEQKAGVCQMRMFIGKFAYLCSGDLMNNTQEDFSPLVLSAAHCASTSSKMEVYSQDLARWSFSFHYEKPGCSNGQYSSSKMVKSVVGCEVLSFIPIVGMSDGLLLKLKTKVPEDYRVYYNGWDRSTAIPTSIAGIHHPSGDAKKISVGIKEGGAPQVTTWHKGLSDQGGKDAHLKFSFREGDTEGGSSGSSLFNQDQLVVGTLTGGSSGTQIYGRLAYHWDQYKDKGPLYWMAKHLDPKSSGSARKLRGIYRNDMRPLYPVSKVNAMPTEQPNRFVVVWDAPYNEAYAKEKYGEANVKYTLLRNGKRVPNAEVKRNDNHSYYAYDEPGESDLVNGKVKYAVRVTYMELPGDQSVTLDSEPVAAMKVSPITTISPSVDKQDGGTQVSWTAPAFNQEWSKFGYETEPNSLQLRPMALKRIPKQEKQSSEQRDAIYVEKWMMGYLPEVIDEQKATPLYVKQVNFVPVKEGNALSLFLSYHYSLLPSNTTGSEPLRVIQKVSVSKAEEGKWKSVVLQTPIRLDVLQTLMVGFSASNASSDRPQVNQVVASGSDPLAKYNGPQALLTNIEIYSKGIGEKLSDEFVDSRDYFAMRLIVSSDPTPLKEPVANVQYGGELLSAVPIVKEYIVKKDGAELKRLKPNRFSYFDSTNTTGSGNYEIEVVYYDLYKHVSVEAVPSGSHLIVYPSVFDRSLMLKGSDSVDRVELFTVDGSRIRYWEGVTSDVTLDVADLPQGTYVVVLHTAGGSYQQKVTKR